MSAKVGQKQREPTRPCFAGPTAGLAKVRWHTKPSGYFHLK
jgi:hypothetical protein